MRRGRAAFAALLAAGLLAGCGGGRRPPGPGARFDPVRFFDGHARSRGTITTALVFGEDFTADFDGRAGKGALLLDERFHFAAGERLQRWRLEAGAAGRVDGTVETQGRDGRLHAPRPVEGRIGEGGLELSYEGYAPGGDTLLGFRQRMTAPGDGTVLNEVRISKFGLPIAVARVVFERVPRTAK